MQNETQDPPFNPNLKSLQNIKYRNESEKRFHKVVVLSLWIMSFTHPFKDVIRTVSLQPFFVHYWTELQLQLYKRFSSQSQTILSIDATGSIFKKISPPADPLNTYESKHLFLYIVIIKMKNSSVPLAQMISATQSMDNIYQWLSKWIGSMKRPTQVICDDSAALIGAVVKAFTKYTTTREYVNHCYEVLEQQSHCNLTCLIRLDTSHFVKILYGLQCFKFVDKRVKHFYVRYLLHLKSCTSYATAKSIIKNLIIVALHKYDRNLSDGNKSKCDKAKEDLKDFGDKDKISLDINVTENSLDVDNIIEVDDLATEGGIITWFNEIVDSEVVCSDLSENTGFENMYYLPRFVDSFRKLILRLPLWSNIMCQYLQCSSNNAPSSSNVESYFKNIKKLLLRSRSGTMRVDDFIMQHTEYLSGEVKVALSTNSDMEKTNLGILNNVEKKSKIIPDKTIKKVDFTKESVFTRDPKLVENWRNKTEIEKHIAMIDQVKPKLNENQIETLPNGNICSSGINKIVVNNTCAFDAVLSALVAICTDNARIAMVMTSLNKPFSNLVCALRHKDVSVNPLRMRTEILKKYYELSVHGNLEVIDCNSNVSFVIEKILYDEIFSAVVTKSCSVCGKNETRKCCILPLNLLTISDYGVGSLNDSASSMIEDITSDCKVKDCSGKICIQYVISDNLIFF